MMNMESPPAPTAPSARSSGTDAAGRIPWRRLALHWGLVIVAVAAAGDLFVGRRAAVSLVLGVVLSGANLIAMYRLTSGLAAPSAGSGWAVLLPFKFVALVAVAFAAVRFGVADPIPLAIGFALLPLTGVFLPAASSVPPGGAAGPRRASPSR